METFIGVFSIGKVITVEILYKVDGSDKRIYLRFIGTGYVKIIRRKAENYNVCRVGCVYFHLFFVLYRVQLQIPT